MACHRQVARLQAELRLAMRALRSEFEDMQELANAVRSHSDESDEASLIEPIEPD